MYCPRCAKADQQPETYCRQCGLFLPDFSKPKKQTRPEEHLKANTVLSLMTIVTSLTLSILLWTILGFKPDTHPLIYTTAGLLLAMSGWQIQTFIRTLMLKQQWKRRSSMKQPEGNLDKSQPSLEPVSNAKFLEQGSFNEAIPPRVTENTTKQLVKKTLE